MTDQTPARPGPAGRHRELPAGLNDILPDSAVRFFDLRRSLLATMTRWGYRPVVLPLLEFAEVFAPAMADPDKEGSLYRQVDRTTGRVLVIRPDFTPQVARIVASRFRACTLPLRLCYEGSVMRHVPAQTGRSREIHQVGAEFLGVMDAEADAEAIALTIACLTEAGLQGFKLDVGQVEFFRGILQGVDLPSEQLQRITGAVARKDVTELDRMLEDLPLPEPKKRILVELPLLAGGVEVLDRASNLAESDHSRAALENISQVVHFVGIHGLTGHLTIDLGELRGIDYHTGVIFEAFVHQMGVPLCRGGRYDRLLGQYGWELPATGFSLDLLALMESLYLQEGAGKPLRSYGVFIINYLPDRSAALKLARALRAGGVPAARDMIRRPLEASLAHARQQSFRSAAVLGQPEHPEDEVVFIDVATGRQQVLSPDQVVQRAAAQE